MQGSPDISTPPHMTRVLPAFQRRLGGSEARGLNSNPTRRLTTVRSNNTTDGDTAPLVQAQVSPSASDLRPKPKPPPKARFMPPKSTSSLRRRPYRRAHPLRWPSARRCTPKAYESTRTVPDSGGTKVQARWSHLDAVPCRSSTHKRYHAPPDWDGPPRVGCLDCLGDRMTTSGLGLLANLHWLGSRLRLAGPVRPVRGLGDGERGRWRPHFRADADDARAQAAPLVTRSSSES